MNYKCCLSILTPNERARSSPGSFGSILSIPHLPQFTLVFEPLSRGGAWIFCLSVCLSSVSLSVSVSLSWLSFSTISFSPFLCLSVTYAASLLCIFSLFLSLSLLFCSLCLFIFSFSPLSFSSLPVSLFSLFSLQRCLDSLSLSRLVSPSWPPWILPRCTSAPL